MLRSLPSLEYFELAQSWIFWTIGLSVSFVVTLRTRKIKLYSTNYGYKFHNKVAKNVSGQVWSFEQAQAMSQFTHSRWHRYFMLSFHIISVHLKQPKRNETIKVSKRSYHLKKHLLHEVVPGHDHSLFPCQMSIDLLRIRLIFNQIHVSRN
jgi:hypothetical protein